MAEPEMTETLARIEEYVRQRLTGLQRNFQLAFRDQGLVLRGRVRSYYAKQLAQHAVMEASSIAILTNEMEVAKPAGRARVSGDHGSGGSTQEC